MVRKLEIHFDNGGGILLQTPNYCHAYNTPAQLAEDVVAILNGSNPRNWDGNEPDYRQSEAHSETNVVSMRMIRNVLAGQLPPPDRGHSESDFWAALLGVEATR